MAVCLFVCHLQYKALAPMYYRDAAAAVVVFDITNPVCTRYTCFHFSTVTDRKNDVYS